MATFKCDLVNVKKRVLEENEYVKNLIDNVPPVYYFDKDTVKQINNMKHQEIHNDLNRMGFGNRKPSSVSKRSKFKRSKLDPSKNKTVSQLIQELPDEDDEDEDEVGDEIDEDVPDSNVVTARNDVELSKDELIQRLKIKLESLRGGRQQSEEILEKQRLKRRLSKLKLKKRRQKNKRMNITPNGLLNGGSETLSERLGNSSSSKTKPVFNKEGKMVFSKFDFSESGIPERKKKKGTPAGKDYKQILEKIQSEKNKFKELKVTDPDKAETLQEKQTWLKAIQKAEGVKIKDDPDLLKKAMKNKERKVKRSKKKWEERNQLVKEKQEKRQKKREGNIKARKDEKVKKKVKRAMKKGRYIPV